MANTITENISKFIPTLDEMYVKGCKTSVLDNRFDAKWDDACSEFKIATRTMDGLSPYIDKYPDGDVKLTWNSYKPNFDMGTKFTIPAIENMENAGLEMVNLLGDFEKYNVYPTLDSFRLSTYVGKAKNKASEDLVSAKSVLQALRKGTNTIEDAEADPSQCYLFIAPSLYNIVADLDTTTSKAVLSEFAGVIKVPQRRLFTGGETVEKKGFQPNVDSLNVNFVIIDKNKVLQAKERLQTKVFTPDENQVGDGYLMPYHRYEIADILKNGEDGVYASISTTKTVE